MLKKKRDRVEFLVLEGELNAASKVRERYHIRPASYMTNRRFGKGETDKTYI